MRTMIVLDEIIILGEMVQFSSFFKKNISVNFSDTVLIFLHIDTSVDVIVRETHF